MNKFLRKYFVFSSFICLAFIVGYSQKPNIIVFLVDDLGWSDLGIQGSKLFKTPNIDDLAKSGLIFTNGYAAHPVCSPSRAGIITGKNPGRLHITQWIGGSENGVAYAKQLPLEENTLAEVLKENGYATGFFGKWHLGESEEYWPEHQGFDVNFGGNNKGSPPGGYFSPYNNPRLGDGPNNEYLTDRLADEAVNWIGQQKENPFFVYFSFYTVHTPIEGKQNTVDYYNELIPTLPPCEATQWMNEIRGSKLKNCDDQATFAAMVHHLDSAVGRVIQEVTSLGLRENTIIIFTSDNGGASYYESTSSNLPLRGAKGWLYEGGIRVPYFIHWPGITQPETTSDLPTVAMDLYPTLLNMAGIPYEPEQHLDGIDLTPWIKASTKKPVRPGEIVFHYPHYHEGNPGTLPGSAIRLGDYKLVEWFAGTSEGDNQAYPYNYELYNLKNDLGEKTDLKDLEPDMANLLRWKLHHYRDTASLNMPLDYGLDAPPVKPIIQGCTAPQADNFNVYATEDDATCEISNTVPVNFEKIKIKQSSHGLTVAFPNQSPFQVHLFDLQGKLVQSAQSMEQSATLKIEPQHHSLHYLQIKHLNQVYVRPVFLY